MLSLFARICDGVNAAHLRGVIHRDLKPGNILVDDQGQPHVLDFGLAKLTDDSAAATEPAHAMTVTGQFVGSLPWASPEQAAGRSDEIDIRTDVYSLGVVLYQLLTGRFPYPVAGRIDEVVRHIVHDSPARPSAIRRPIDRELETIVLKCLAKEPERRYQSAGELARDLRRYLAGEAIEARRDSLTYVISKGLARHRVAAFVAATVTLAVFCALVVSLGFWQQAEEQRKLAEHNATAAFKAAELADSEAAQSRAVLDFMREVLTSVEPENQGADVRLVQVLAHASQTASQRFAAHPQQEAEVRELLGKVYDTLSLWTDAEVEFKAAVDLWTRHVGADDPRTLKAESTYAGLVLNLTRYREVEAALTALLPRMARVLGPDDRETLAARRSLAVAILHQGRHDEAEVILTELRAHPVLANDDGLQLRIAQSLTDVLHWRRYLSSRAVWPESLAKEEALAREWIDRSTRFYGPTNAITLQARVVLAEIVADQGDHAAAADQCRDLLELTAGRLPDCHDLRAYAMVVLAGALGNLGEVDEPADLYLRRIECIRKFGPPARAALLSAINDSLGYLELAGRGAEGEPLARELGTAMQKFNSDLAFVADIYVARFVSLQNRLDDADELFQSLLNREDQLSDSRSRGRLHMYFARHLILRGLYEPAEQQLQVAESCVDDLRLGTHDTQPDDLILAYIALYEAWNKPDQVEEYEHLRDKVFHVTSD